MNKFKLRVYLKSFDFCLLNKLENELKQIAANASILISGPVYLPTKKERFNILRSPHVNKKSRDQLEISIHKRLIDFLDVDENFIFLLKDVFLGFSLELKFKFLK